MNNLPAVLALGLFLAACAPTLNSTAPVQITTSVSYATQPPKAGEDNSVLAAIVAIAPTAPHEPTRQPWRAEDIERNSVVLRSNPNTVANTTFSLANYPQEMSWNVISAGGITTVTATHSSAYAAAVSDIFAKLDAKFIRMK
ncbi:hypothetical protein ACFP9V_03945 [Deinococcus radiopugnans]|uniref:Uncharacterized protein n=1 Tax=Deinococcus radiopugnans ATCC 19172 TaxID=585398 RepID=A0A5C4Y7Z8_9DEIO|nr:hypothetical protein [Deinococcus radiopugnans]MBB6016925.1 hypothetical protein [Deinococcus radiopugnans ATCC 19172]TNM71478.1 hypothetical protein FHR04_07975 [Deinococcus radiopugnans ATCC 19172]